MSVTTPRPPRTTPRLQLPVPGDADPADYVTDTGAICDRLDQIAAPNTAVGMTRIFDQPLAADTPTIQMSSIPQTYTHLRLMLSARSTDTAASVNVMVRFNGDANANYDHQWLLGSATAVAAGDAVSQAWGMIGAINGAATPGLFAGIACDIFAYANPLWHKRWASHASVMWTLASGGQANQSVAGGWRGGAAINAITLFLTAGSFAANSRATLYGLA